VTITRNNLFYLGSVPLALVSSHTSK